MLYLGIDTGKNNIGYAVYDSSINKIIDYGDINPVRNSIDKKEISYCDLTEKLYVRILGKYTFKQAILEKIFATAQTLPNVYAAIEATGVIKQCLEAEGIEFCTISPKSAKKAFAGNGNASKEDIAKCVGNRFDIFGQSTHTNDAIAIVTGWYMDNHVTTVLPRG